MQTIFLVRHGENLANITKEFSYKHVDYSLTKKGRLQAQQTAAFFVDQRITHIYSSPLKRAYETAEIIAQRLQLKIEVREAFREINVGSFEGQPVTKELWTRHNEILTAWEQGDHHRSFPDGENYIGLLERMKRGLHEICSTPPGSRVIIVGHGGIFTTTIRDICTNVEKEELARIENHNCSITRLERSGEQTHLIYWAKSDHLSGEAAELIPGGLKT